MKKLKFYLLSSVIAIALTACSGDQKQKNNPEENSDLKMSDPNHPDIGQAPKLHYEVFKVEAPGVGYGYVIYLNDNLYIRQENIPAVSGNKGFSSEVKASGAAELVMEKIRQNIMPPSVSREELEQAGLLD